MPVHLDVLRMPVAIKEGLLGRYYGSGLKGIIGEAAIGANSNMTNVAVATPFAYSVLLPPEVWNAVFTLIKYK